MAEGKWECGTCQTGSKVLPSISTTVVQAGQHDRARHNGKATAAVKLTGRK